MRIKYTQDLMTFMRLFDQITRTKLNDCFVDSQDKLTFVVDNKDIGNAIGKKASNIRKLENVMKRKVRIIAYNQDILIFIRNLLHPIKVEEVTQDEDVITIKPLDSKSRGIIIGRNASNLRNTESIAKRYFEINEIKVM